MKIVFSTVLAFLSICHAWIPSKQVRNKLPTTGTALFNVPPPSTDDKEAFKKFADKQPAPASFFELQQDCIRSVEPVSYTHLTLPTKA